LEGPRVVIWIFTSLCNLNCPHCYAYRFRGVNELTLKEKLRLVKEMGELGVEHVGISGGEPLIHKDIIPIIKTLTDHDISISIVTNAQHVREDVVRTLSECNVHLYVSLDGPKEVHDKIRGAGSYDRIMKSIEKFREHGVDYSMVMAINKLNYRYVKDFIFESIRLNSNFASFIPTMKSGKAILTGVRIDFKNFMWAIRVIDDTSRELSYPISLWCTPFASIIVKSKYIRSSYCRTQDIVDVDPAGNLLLCDVIDIRVSSVKGRTLSQAVKEYYLNDVVWSVINPPKIPKPCMECPLHYKCKSGCYARALIEYNDLNAGDPLCPKVVEWRKHSKIKIV